MHPVLAEFHPVVREWFSRRFAAPSRAQELGWPIIGAAGASPRHDVLLCAPTGSGKTLAAFMWAIDGLVREAERGSLADTVSVLYVSPLKALANDIRLNLDEPLDVVREIGAARGIDLGVIRAGLRTGDTPASERSAMLKRPPQILVTTPESLFLLLTSPRFRAKLASVRHVIVDELHALAGNKRGAHLAVTLERLERFVRASGGERPTRIGLSATLNPIEQLAEFLAGFDPAAEGARTSRPVKIVRADDRPRKMDLQVVAPGPELGPLATHQHWDAMYDQIADLIREHRTTLIFTLSRRWAERVAVNLQKRVGADAVMAHHGSLARKERVLAEQRLKRGELRAIVATASLELGIDVGAVELVCQIDSPKSISAAIQRIGRSGHSLGATPKGRFFALTTDDLLECAAAVRAIRAGHLDEVEIPSGCLDIAAQQIIAIAAEEDEISESDLLRILRGAYNLGGLDADGLARLLEQMATELPERISGAAPKIFFDRNNHRVRPRRGARIAAIMSGGTIPESGNYDVVIESEGRKIGDVEEDFAQESARGDVFSLGSMPWQIQRTSRGRLMVEAAPGMAPTLPFWLTEAGGRSLALSAEIAALRHEIAARLEIEGDAGAARWLAAECALTDSAAAQAVDYVRRGVAALGAIPDSRPIVVERFFDGLGGTQIVIHAPFGIRFNRGLGLALRKRLCQSFDFEIQASAIDDGVLIALNARHSFPLEETLAMLPARSSRAVLEQAMIAAPMFEVRFRHVASRALTVMRAARGSRIPAWIQRLRSQEALAALFPQQQACFENRPPAIEIPGHFIIAETMRECLTESADADRMERVLAGVADGSVRTVFVDSVSPSVFAHRLLLAWDYSFLDGGERANRRSRTVSMNRGMAEDVFRNEDLSELLAEDAVRTVASEVTGTALGYRARNRDELYELIRAHGGLSAGQIDERAGEGARTMLEELAREQRIARVVRCGTLAEIVIASEDAVLFAAAYPGSAIIGASDLSAADPDSAQQEIVRRALKTSGPTTVDELALRLGLDARIIERVLQALEASGAVFRGHFTSATTTQWCERYNLERIHRMTLARVRAEIEPCAEHEFAAFRLRWMYVGGRDIAADAAGVTAVLEQLSGLAYAPGFWERAILPARIHGYRAEMLDVVCLGGQMRWAAVAQADEARTSPALITFIARRAALADAPVLAEVEDPREQSILAALHAGGAQYLDQVSERANLSERDTLAALWRLAARGFASNDSFAPLRMLASEPAAADAFENPPSRGFTRHDAAIRARLKSSVSGRWSVIEASPEASARDSEDADPAREFAMRLLARNGILSREMLALETSAMTWHDVSFALRRLEYGGAIRRGWFVRALSAEQYALPEAVEMLREARALNPAREKPIAIRAADPANPYGLMLPGCGVARDATNLVVLRAGKAVLGLASRALVTIGGLDDEAFSAAVTALIEVRAKIVLDTIDGAPARGSPRVGMLAAMRFHSDGRSLVFDGLPGPTPARAAHARRG
ncbi:MAG: DEAD/DEAH box helicase [Candidatus Binataceae bacterium]